MLCPGFAWFDLTFWSCDSHACSLYMHVVDFKTAVSTEYWQLFRIPLLIVSHMCSSLMSKTWLSSCMLAMRKYFEANCATNKWKIIILFSVSVLRYSLFLHVALLLAILTRWTCESWEGGKVHQTRRFQMLEFNAPSNANPIKLVCCLEENSIRIKQGTNNNVKVNGDRCFWTAWMNMFAFQVKILRTRHRSISKPCYS